MSKRTNVKKEEEDTIVIRDGLTKKILKKGNGSKPKPGQLCYVHYVGKLQENGEVFDSSRSRNRPFSFQLHKGQVIMGWDLGVSTMSKGEKAVLTCSPDYAYGSRGADGVIPPNATLIFEVDLLEFRDDDRTPISWLVTLLICAIPILMVCLKFGIISFD